MFQCTDVEEDVRGAQVVHIKLPQRLVGAPISKHANVAHWHLRRYVHQAENGAVQRGQRSALVNSLPRRKRSASQSASPPVQIMQPGNAIQIKQLVEKSGGSAK